MPRTKSSVDNELLLSAALEGLLLQRQRIEEQIADVRSRLGKRVVRDSGSSDGTVAHKRNLSPEARKRIAAAQKRRWAEYRKNAEKHAE